jgi:ribonuclease HII
MEELCEKNPELKEHYSLHTNMGYGTKAHFEGIRNHGITEWHRKSFKGVL